MPEIVGKFGEPSEFQWSLAMLTSFRDDAVRVRMFMLDEHKRHLEALGLPESFSSSEGSNANFDLEARVYLELFERLCLLIEDFATLLSALQQPIEMFSVNVGKKVKPKHVLKSMTSASVRELMFYAPVEQKLPKELGEPLETIRQKNIDVIMKVASMASKWLGLQSHWQMYNNLKHGNALVHSIVPINVWNERTYGYFGRTNLGAKGRNPVMYLNKTMYCFMRKLFEAIATCIVDLSDRCLYAHGSMTKILELSFLFPPSDEELQFMKHLFQSLTFPLPHRPIDHIHVDIEPIISDTDSQRLLKFYQDLLADCQPGRMRFDLRFQEIN